MSEILGLIMLFAPLFAVMWLANLAQARREQEQPYGGPAVAAYVMLAAIYGLGVAFGGLMQVAALAVQLQPDALAGLPPQLSLASLPLLALGIWGPSLGGLILLLPPVRRLAARFTPLDADSPVHAVALSLTMLVAINLMITLGIGLDGTTPLNGEKVKK